MSEICREPISADHASFSEKKIPVDEHVSLRIVSWQPKDVEPSIPIVFIAGWVSIVAGWSEFIHTLTKEHPVYYIETREKESAEIRKKRLGTEDFSMEVFAQDVITACSRLPIDIEDAIVSGSSMGATVLLEALKHERLKARGTFLIGPTDEFHAPWLFRWVPYVFPASAYHLVKHYIVWHFRHFRVNVEKEPEQMRRYENTILSAHPLRIKLSARAFLRYKVWPQLETVRSPTRIAFASTDKLHASDSITRMAEVLEQADLLPCKSNKYMHSAQLAGDIDRFIIDLETCRPRRATAGNRAVGRSAKNSVDLQESTSV